MFLPLPLLCTAGETRRKSTSEVSLVLLLHSFTLSTQQDRHGPTTMVGGRHVHESVTNVQIDYLDCK
jgi:hypothetical protein